MTITAKNEGSVIREPQPNAFVEFQSQVAQLAAGPAGDTEVMIQAGGILSAAFSSGSASATLLGAWADALEQGVAFERGRSQIHNNGFSKISLAKLPGGWNIRLHVWPAGGRDPRVHDHRWSFASVALAGRLDVVNYIAQQRSGSGGEQVYRLYDATGDGEKKIERDVDVDLRPSASYRLAAGAFHILDYRDPHIVWNNADVESVTLMVSGPAQREYSHSYGERDGMAVLPAPALVTDEDAIAHVRKVVANLEGTR